MCNRFIKRNYKAKVFIKREVNNKYGQPPDIMKLPHLMEIMNKYWYIYAIEYKLIIHKLNAT
ncbi:MAG: hypothetical protein DIZ80_04895 [endosymbiont of Galathealinum brachiosum]|uniref:Uncharacterized protein n=1 Tax=endosymbiont of Galathealinum brachiosum TaxID=2200906 RepID=A0A370DIQ9_9GAMM|nr:MAG: hypothetical protein DIZ80_04895 [endosymbiont of Galathealinum brachiosum]